MKKQIIIASIIITNLIILGCGQSGYGWESPKDVPELAGEAADVLEPEIVLEPDIVLPLESAVTEVPVPEASAPANPETTASNPLQANTGTHTYSSQAYSFDCTCTEAGTVTSNFVFSGDTVADGNNIYTKTGENTYTRSWMGQSILVVDGKDTILDIQKHAVLIFSKHGYVLENYSDADPSSGAFCCYYEFTLEE